MFKLRRLRCSFCGKGESEVLKLVAGPRVLICDACVAAAKRLMDADAGDAPTRGVAAPLRRRLLERARRLLRGRDRTDEKLSQASAPLARPSPIRPNVGR